MLKFLFQCDMVIDNYIEDVVKSVADDIVSKTNFNWTIRIFMQLVAYVNKVVWLNKSGWKCTKECFITNIHIKFFNMTDLILLGKTNNVRISTSRIYIICFLLNSPFWNEYHMK